MKPEHYRKQWATLTGRRESDVYVPEGIRPFERREGARIVLDGIGGTVMSVSSTGLMRIRWDDGVVSHEYVDENGAVI